MLLTLGTTTFLFCRTPSRPFNSEFSSSNWSVQYDQVMGRHRRPRAAAAAHSSDKAVVEGKQCRDDEGAAGLGHDHKAFTIDVCFRGKADMTIASQNVRL